MPPAPPTLDDRRYADLLGEALARVPVHNPAWTNLSPADPGVTVLELFAFLTETLLYRANQIPDRNRRKFLRLLGVPVRPAAPARALLTFQPLKSDAVLVPAGAVVGGAVPFVTDDGVVALPVEGRAFYKRKLRSLPAEVAEQYKALYASFDPAKTTGTGPAATLAFYEPTPLPPGGETPVRLAGPDKDTIDGDDWVWVALLAPEKPPQPLEAVRAAVGGKVLTLGVVPWLDPAAGREVTPAAAGAAAAVTVQVPCPPPPDGEFPAGTPAADRVACYRTLPAAVSGDLVAGPGLVSVTLPGKDDLIVWENLDPLEAGAGDFPPAPEDEAFAARVVTWVRVRGPAAVAWVGVNAATAVQRTRVRNERLADGTGEPDQVFRLAAGDVIPGSVRLRVTAQTGTTTDWTEIDDLAAAGPEVPAPNPAAPPGRAPAARPASPYVFKLDAAAGTLTTGTGLRGARPPAGSKLTADYDTTAGAAGNLGAGQVTADDPAGWHASNPVRTWGGAAAESVADAERLVPRYVAHGDRLVTEADFEDITLRTPGAAVGRVEVLAATAPAGPAGARPGAVTVLVVPAADRDGPAPPAPDAAFLDAVCRHLAPRRLVTTELFVRGPVYTGLWVSFGLDVVAGVNPGPVAEAVRRAVRDYLHPLPADPDARFTAAPGDPRRGWPLGRGVTAAELAAVAARVAGVRAVREVLLAPDGGPAAAEVPLPGTLALPWLLGVAAGGGAAVPLDALRGRAEAGPPPTVVPVPVLAAEC